MSDYQEKIKSLKGKYMKKKVPKKERFVRWLIKKWLPDHHLSRNPVKKPAKFIFVNSTNKSDGQNGLTPDTAMKTIAEAITQVNKFDTICVIPNLEKEIPPIQCDPGSGQAGTFTIPVPLDAFGAGGSMNDINR